MVYSTGPLGLLDPRTLVNRGIGLFRIHLGTVVSERIGIEAVPFVLGMLT